MITADMYRSHLNSYGSNLAQVKQNQSNMVVNSAFKDGVKIVNEADKFPSTVKLTLKALAVDPCSPDVLRGVYIVIPSFQVSPEVEISLTTDGQLQYSGSMQMNYCSDTKALYEVYFADGDEE